MKIRIEWWTNHLPSLVTHILKANGLPFPIPKRGPGCPKGIRRSYNNGKKFTSKKTASRTHTNQKNTEVLPNQIDTNSDTYSGPIVLINNTISPPPDSPIQGLQNELATATLAPFTTEESSLQQPEFSYPAFPIITDEFQPNQAFLSTSFDSYLAPSSTEVNGIFIFIFSNLFRLIFNSE
jgi:hypothetical protein